MNCYLWLVLDDRGTKTSSRMAFWSCRKDQNLQALDACVEREFKLPTDSPSFSCAF